MRKTATLLMLFLGVSLILHTTHAQETYCQIQYADYYDPNETCDYLVDDEGFGRVNCATHCEGSCGPLGEESSSVVEASNPTFSNPSFPVKNIWFFGDCDCSIRVYSRENLGGCYVESSVNSDNVQRAFGEGLWNKAGDPQSISVTCRF